MDKKLECALTSLGTGVPTTSRDISEQTIRNHTNKGLWGLSMAILIAQPYDHCDMPSSWNCHGISAEIHEC